MKTIFILFIFLASIFAQEPTGVILLFRHGARGPVDHDYDNTWESMYGELTPVGMRQQYLRGAYLSQLYPKLFSKFDSNTFSIRSTDYNRTLMSVYSLLDGLLNEKGPTFIDSYPFNRSYPPYSASFLDTHLDVLPHRYQAVPIRTLEQPQDELLLSGDYTVCPITKELELNQSNDPSFKELVARFDQTITEVSQRMNSSTNLSLVELDRLHDTIVANYFEGKPLPGNIDPNSDLGKNLTFLMGYKTYFVMSGTALQKQLVSMNLLNQFKIDIQKILHTSSPSVKLYSAHDTTLHPILAIAGIADHECLYKNFFENGNFSSCYYPKFASQIRIEVWRNDTELNSSRIGFFFDEMLQNLCKTETGYCAWEDFEKLLNNYTQGKDIHYYRKVCSSSSLNLSQNESTASNNNTVGEIPDGPDLGFQYAIYALTGVAGTLFIGIIYAIGKKLERESKADGYLI